MENIIHKDIIDVGDIVYFIFKKSLRIGRKKEVVYDTNDPLKVLSCVEDISGDDENPTVTIICKVEDSNGYIFDTGIEILSLNPDDKRKRAAYYGRRAVKIGLLLAAFAGLIICAYYRN